MDITVSQAQSRVPVTIIHLYGPVRMYEPLQQQAQAAFDSGARDILVDLTDVPYMATAGLRALNYMHKMLDRDTNETSETVGRGIAAGTYMAPHLKLLNPSKHVYEVLKAAGYDMFIEIHWNLKDALASF